MTPLKQHEKSSQEAQSLLFRTIKQESNNLKKPGGFLETHIDANASAIAQEALQRYRENKLNLNRFDTEAKIKILADYLASKKLQPLKALIAQKEQELNNSQQVRDLLRLTQPYFRTKELWERDLRKLESSLRSTIARGIIPHITPVLQQEIAQEGSRSTL